MNMKTDIESYWENRATVRNFSDKPVDDSLLEDLLAKASHAPTTGNMQLYSVIITRDPKRKKLLEPAHFSQPASVSAPVLLTFCADYNRFAEWCRQRQAEPAYDNFQSFIAALLDTALLAQQFNTLAELAGLGCCYLGTTTYNAPRIAELLRLPDLVVPVITLAVGYPAAKAVASDRIPASGFIHKEEYRAVTPEEIDFLYKPKEAMPENKAFVEENGKQTLAQVFTDIRYNRRNNEYFSKVYLEFIRKQQFLNS